MGEKTGPVFNTVKMQTNENIFLVLKTFKYKTVLIKNYYTNLEAFHWKIKVMCLKMKGIIISQ